MNVSITNDFRLVSDDRNIIVQRRVLVDPTKSPAYDPAKHGTVVREEWRDNGFFPLTTKGLAAAIDCVAFRKVAAEDGEKTLPAFVAEVRRISEELKASYEAILTAN
jgi:hypothetical protein